MGIDVMVLPRTERAIQWIGSNAVRLQRVFMEAHGPDDPALRKFHPHGLSLGLPEYPLPNQPPLYIQVDAHGSRSHGDRTVADLQKVLKDLGAPVSELDTGRTDD